jgi:prolyl-tRNA synthetase
MPGWKYAEYEMKGVPIRLEIGPRDLEQGQCVAVSRDNREKEAIPLDQATDHLPVLLEALRTRIYQKAKERLESRIFEVADWDQFVETMATVPGFILAAWCGSPDCEAKVKEETTATSRCMAEGEVSVDEVCVVCGKPAKHRVYWGKAY